MAVRDKIFAFSDVHGRFDLMEKMLQYWNSDQEQLVMLGDLNDRGPQSRECFLRARDLKERYGAELLLGNHEELLKAFLQDPAEYEGIYLVNGGQETLGSLLGLDDYRQVSKLDVNTIPEAVRQINPWLDDYLAGLSRKFEWQNYVFVHAGVNLTLDDWRETSDQEMSWIREGFIDVENKFDKTFVFGHTPTPKLHHNPTNYSIWQGQKKIGIDGGAVYGGQLNGLLIGTDGIEKVYEVK